MSPLDQDSISQYITGTFDSLDVVVASGNSFFFYDPGKNIPPDRRLPFATLVTNDDYDRFSNLNRPSVFRLNIGVSRDTYLSLFGSRHSPVGAGEVADSGDTADGSFDYTALDQIMPHPIYGRMFWICVLNPSTATFQAVRPLLAEAYDLAARRHARVRPVEES